jgi:drug/metabolite transporter (DMT)-like permease
MTRAGFSGYLRRVNGAILFAILSGLAAATWTICLKLGSSRISAVPGAMVITGVAFVVNSIALLVLRAGGHEPVTSREGVWLLAAAGLAASGVDIFGLLAYERGLRVTSSFLVGGTSTVVVLLFGFLALHEPVTWGRLAAIAMIVGGTLLYQLQGR